jgi:hypothetical protein
MLLRSANNTFEHVKLSTFAGQKIVMKIKYRQYFWSLVIVLASVRGALVYHFGFPPSTTYKIIGALLICFGLLSFRSMLVNKGKSAFVLLRNGIMINTLLMGFYMLVSMVAISFNQYAMALLFAVVPIIFTLVRYNERLLNGIVYAISIVTSFGVVYLYNMGKFSGYDAIRVAHSTLRPEKFSYSRIGENLLPFGYQGDHHDAANILVMCSVFFLSKAILEWGVLKKCLYLSVYFFVLFVTLLTGSAANTIVLIGASGLALIFYAKKHPYVMVLIVCCALLALPSILDSLSDFTYFYEKASYNQAELAGGGMFNSLDLNSIFASFYAILFGFGFVFEVPLMHSEIAFVKALIAVGLIPFLVFMFICFSPLYYINKFRKNSKAQVRTLRYHNPGISTVNFIKTRRAQQHRLIISAMPALAGIMTFLHYGSLFRVTSVGLFCVMLAFFFKEYLVLNNVRVR